MIFRRLTVADFSGHSIEMMSYYWIKFIIRVFFAEQIFFEEFFFN